MSNKSTKQTNLRILTATLYCYVEPANYTRAKRKAATFASFSNYVNFLIAKDHGDKASMKRSQELADKLMAPKATHFAEPRRVKPKKAAPKKTARKATKKAAPKKTAKKATRSTKAVVSTKKARKTPGFFGKILKNKTPSQVHAH